MRKKANALQKGEKMKVLAIIPARGGSKGIPNKNIRLLGNHPLVYYAIHNAMTSRYITDILVSTDSVEVATIAGKMGVAVKMRNPKLAGDDVTLDAVVHDAAGDYDVDYVVTLQPTSPTLSVETLDAAIAYCMENRLDTVISAINAPHLAWKEDNGRKVPAYEKRLNRQYLPPYYVETGAFVISRKDAVKENTRIGKKVDIYEVSEREAIDIDTFLDFKSAECILKSYKVAIYVNGNSKRGMGHVHRALELADEFSVKPDIYYDVNQTDRLIFGDTTHNLIGVNGIVELFSRIKQEQYEIFINDILTTSIDYMIGLKTCLPNAKIINFEDDGEGILKADLIINALYDSVELPQMYAGEKYYIAPKLFLCYPPVSIKQKVERVFISFGGSDPQNYTDRILGIIRKAKYEKYRFEVVLGKAKHNAGQLAEQYGGCGNITLYHDIKNMPEIMSMCDIGITSRGRTGYELAILGIPTIAMAQNKREEKHGFVCNENGFSYLGLNPSDYMMEATLDIYLQMDAAERKRLQDTLLGHDLRNGRKRIMSLIDGM